MAVDETTVRRIAKLARIAVTDEEARSFQNELSSIFSWIEQLDEVDISNVEPMTSAVRMQMKKREDVVDDGEYPDVIVANAPAKQDHFFIVPKVVE